MNFPGFGDSYKPIGAPYDSEWFARSAFDTLEALGVDAPHGDDGFWARLGGLSTDALFVWGRHDTLVPIAFMKHVERALPAARHVELDCGHVPQLERPRETHAAMIDFLRTK